MSGRLNFRLISYSFNNASENEFDLQHGLLMVYWSDSSEYVSCLQLPAHHLQNTKPDIDRMSTGYCGVKAGFRHMSCLFSMLQYSLSASKLPLFFIYDGSLLFIVAYLDKVSQKICNIYIFEDLYWQFLPR
jgi:hypothetical protein